MTRHDRNTPGSSGMGTGAATIEQSRARTKRQLGVLVVDDNKAVRMLLESGLKHYGFRVWLAANGWDAIDVYRDHGAIAVVLLDVQMPGIDGPQTLDALRELDPELPACFMTGNPETYTVDELRQRGAAHVFTKPFVLEDVARALRQLAEGEATEFLSADETVRQADKRRPERNSAGDDAT